MGEGTVQAIADVTKLARIDGARIAILQSKWYREHTDLMVSKCIEVLESRGGEWEHHALPGTLEIPLACQSLARTKRYDAIICVGVVLKGETRHFEMVVDETVRSLGQVMLNEDVPVIVEVIPATTIEQVIARTANDEYNKGIEAGATACEVIDWRRLALAS
jgi:6,7-dimethyl-8-ribityllumazine synthase